MIQINLLPNEYRKTEATPVARFIAIVAGAVLITGALVGYGFVHYSKLNGVREVRKNTEAEFSNKTAQSDASKALQTEINAYEHRRKAIQTVAKSRILHSRKLDEFLDVIHNKDDRSTYFVWLNGLTVKPGRVSKKKRRGRSTGGAFSFAGFSETTEFSRITNLRDAIKKDVFYKDFLQISSPNFKAKVWHDELQPSEAGSFSFSLVFKPLGWRHATSKKKK